MHHANDDRNCRSASDAGFGLVSLLFLEPKVGDTQACGVVAYHFDLCSRLVGRIDRLQLQLAAPCVVISLMICSRMTYFCGLPVAVMGNSDTNRTYRGIL